MAVSYQRSVIGYRLLADRWKPTASAIRHPPSAIRYPPSKCFLKNRYACLRVCSGMSCGPSNSW
jgi:hypothetical protein